MAHAEAEHSQSARQRGQVSRLLNAAVQRNSELVDTVATLEHELEKLARAHHEKFGGAPRKPPSKAKKKVPRPASAKAAPAAGKVAPTKKIPHPIANLDKATLWSPREGVIPKAVTKHAGRAP